MYKGRKLKLLQFLVLFCAICNIVLRILAYILRENGFVEIGLVLLLTDLIVFAVLGILLCIRYQEKKKQKEQTNRRIGDSSQP